MIDEHHEEQASLYVLGVLGPEETHALETRLATDDELREHVRSLLETTAALAHAAPLRALPPQLESRVMADIRPATADKVTNFPLPRAAWIPWAVAASLAIACVVAFSQRQRLSDQLAAAQAEIGAARDAAAGAESRAAAAQAQLANLAKDKDRAEEQLVELQRREADARTQMTTLAAARDEALKNNTTSIDLFHG